MRLGLRAILLLVALIFFIVAAISNGDTAFNFLCIGLACTAGALLVEELNFSGMNFPAAGTRNRN